MHVTLASFVQNDLNNYEGRIRRLKGVPGTSRYTQLLRYGKKKYLEIYKEQSDRRTAHFLNIKSNWINRGYSEQEAERLVSDVQKSRSVLSPSAQKGANIFSRRCIGYWIAQGFTETEAKSKVSDFQRRKHTTERNIKWQEVLQAKSQEEKALINRKKGHTVEAYLLRGYSQQESETLSREYWKKRKNYSQASQSFFIVLHQLMKTDRVYYKIFNYEKQFNGRNVDFFHQDSGTVVEFYGDFWHRNPSKYDAGFVAYGKTSDEIWNIDKERIHQIHQHESVNHVIIVWESEVALNPHLAAEKIIQEIHNGSN